MKFGANIYEEKNTGRDSHRTNVKDIGTFVQIFTKFYYLKAVAKYLIFPLFVYTFGNTFARYAKSEFVILVLLLDCYLHFGLQISRGRASLIVAWRSSWKGVKEEESVCKLVMYCIVIYLTF